MGKIHFITRIQSRILQFGIQIGLIIGLVGCGGIGISELAPADTQREQRFREITKRYAESLMKEDYKSMYELCSSHLQSNIPMDTFIKNQMDAREKYGKPLKYEIDYNSIDPKEMMDEEYEFPDYIPKDSWEAWMIISLALEVDKENEVERCYDCWILIVNDNGTDKVAHIEYDWCD